MNLVIKEKKEEPLLSRTEIVAEVTFENATPAKKDILAQIASSLKVAENLIKVRKISVLFGSRTANVLAYKYTDEKSKENIEPKKVKKSKESPKEGKEGATTPAPEKDKKEEAKPAPEAK